MVVLNVGLLALVAAMSSGAASIARASRITTAAALADNHMELYRSLRYGDIHLNSSSVDSADSTYKNDPAIGGDVTKLVRTCTVSPVPNECNASRTATGADSRSYRIDTYITRHTPTGGRETKLVTIAVRDTGDLKTLARQVSSFDRSTG